MLMGVVSPQHRERQDTTMLADTRLSRDKRNRRYVSNRLCLYLGALALTEGKTKQAKRKDANSVFVEERPDVKIKFDNSDAAALAHSGFAIRCLYRDWDRYILYCQFFLFR